MTKFTTLEGDVSAKDVAKLRGFADHVMQGDTPTQKILARNQPCGCIVCYCENEDQCQGCGSKSCRTHKNGKIPNPVFVDTPTQTNNRMQPIETAPQNIPVIVSGGISIKDSAGDWWSCMTVPQRKLQWAPGWWAPISYTDAPPQWTRKNLAEAIEDLFFANLGLTPWDRAYKVVDWIDQNLMPIPEDTK